MFPFRALSARFPFNSYINNCELHVKTAGGSLGKDAKKSIIYAEQAKETAGAGMKDCELHVKKTTDWLGVKAKNSKIYADEAGEGAGIFMQNSQFSILKPTKNPASSKYIVLFLAVYPR